MRRDLFSLPLGDPVRRGGLALVCIALFIGFGLAYDNFATTNNALAIGLNVSSLAIAALGAALLLISGHVDLSVGSQYALLAVTVATVARDTQSAGLAILVGLTAGATVGLINGLLVRALSINPLIVTLGLLMVYRGAAFVVADGLSVSGLPTGLLVVGRGRPGGIPLPILVAAVLFVAVTLYVRKSVWGLRIYAIGGNVEAARARGVPVGRLVVGLYAFNGLLIGVIAILGIGRLGSATPQLGVGFELDVLTAVILGGVAFTGGSGRATGLIAGIATIGVLNAGLVFMGLQDWWQNMARGAVLLFALGADQITSRRRESGRGIFVQHGFTKRTADRLRQPRNLWRSILAHRRPVTSDEVAAQSPDAPSGVAVLTRGRLARASNGQRKAVLRCRDIDVRFGSVIALRRGNLDVASGEVVCLVGDNGAGKSTLVKAVAGIVRPTAGSIELEDKRVEIADPADARAAGIETVHQDLALCPNLGVVHNLVLGDEPRRRFAGVLTLRDDIVASKRAHERLEMLSVRLADLNVLVRSLSGGQQQSVAIARALRSDVRVVILDEPTAALGVTQSRNVLEQVRRIADRGTAIVMISHDIETVFAIADRITVLRLGEVVHDGPAAALSEGELLHLMAGLARTPQPSGADGHDDPTAEEVHA